MIRRARGESVHPFELLERRHDIERSEAAHAVRMVERHPICDPAATVMARNVEPIKAEGRHRFDEVERHRALGIRQVLVVGRRFAARAIAAQVGRHHGEALRKARRDLVPDRVCLWIAVDEQQRRSAAALDEGDLRARSSNPLACEAFEHRFFTFPCGSVVAAPGPGRGGLPS